MSSTTYDEARAEAFAGRMLDLLNGGALAVMISVGHRTGLFDALAEHPGATSQELADAAGLDERYVREWLGAMTAGRIVELDPATARYSLPAEHAAWLTRAASPDNLAVEAQWITSLSAVEDDIVDCFREGGGVPYERYARFHEVMAEESAQTVLSVLFSHILPLVPGMSERLEEGASLLDLGCGRGRALARARRALPEQHLPGIRPLARRDRVRDGPGGRTRARERQLRAARSQHVRRGRGARRVRLRRDVRRGARPGEAARAAEGHPSLARARRRRTSCRTSRARATTTRTSTTPAGRCST